MWKTLKPRSYYKISSFLIKDSSIPQRCPRFPMVFHTSIKFHPSRFITKLQLLRFVPFITEPWGFARRVTLIFPCLRKSTTGAGPLGATHSCGEDWVGAGKNNGKVTRPGKRLHNNGKSPCYYWENSLFLWPCSIAFCMFPRGYGNLSNKLWGHWLEK